MVSFQRIPSVFTAACLVAPALMATGFQLFNNEKSFGRLSTTTFMHGPDHPMDWERDRRQLEFMDLEPLPESDSRKKRIARDLKNKEQFVNFGNDLWKLRGKLQSKSELLMGAMDRGDNDEIMRLRKEIRQLERRDPEYVYERETLEFEIAQLDGRMEDALEHKGKAEAARSCLPQFNLEGLWVGKYGDHGYEMINITYVGDVLIAFKVTGDKNVPQGEITFQADLSPLPKTRLQSGGKTMTTSPKQENTERLRPIKLTEKAAKKWRTEQLPRYRGLGQVAEEGFRNNRWMDGQLIMIGEEYFSFAWVPLEQQIFFGRPSPELSLKMLRDSGNEVLRDAGWWEKDPPSVDDDVRVLKAYVSSCFDKTHETIEDELKGAQMGCIWEDETTAQFSFE